MNVMSSAYPQKVQRLRPTLDNLSQIGGIVACVFLLPTIIIRSFISAAKEIRHSPKEALEELLLPTPCACIMILGGLGYGIYSLFYDLIFGRPN